MTDNQILNFKPYQSLCYWLKILIFITIDKLEEFLSFFGYKINIKEFQKKNVSKKLGKFNEATKENF